jgi:hypothetical protein
MRCTDWSKNLNVISGHILKVCYMLAAGHEAYKQMANLLKATEIKILRHLHEVHKSEFVH